MNTRLVRTRTGASRRIRYALAAVVAGIAGALLPLHSPLAHAQTYTVLSSFNGTNGANPVGSLVLSDSTLYGMTAIGGANNDGTIFSEPVAGGAPTTLASFNYTNGFDPCGSLTLSGSTLYGMARSGGANGYGTIFSEPVAGGAPTVLASFNGDNGAGPYGSLILSGSTLYGTASYGGGANDGGTVFSERLSGGAPTVLASFNGTNGSYPLGSLILIGSTLYGTTSNSGAYGDGTIFSVPVAGGALTVLASFNGTNGADPYGSLILSGSTLYGMTHDGGANNLGAVFCIPVTGGDPTVLASFNGTNGQAPVGSLILSGSTLYGATQQGGANLGPDGHGYGTIFSEPITGGDPTVLVSFTGTGGSYPGYGSDGSLLLSGSTLYGTTGSGRANNDGVIFSYTDPSIGGGPSTPEPASWLSFLVFAAIVGLIARRRRFGRMKAEG